MQLGRVIGNCVSTCKTECSRGIPLLIVRLLDETLKPTKKTIVCSDTVHARPGNIVLTCGSSSARMTSRTRNVCTDNAIVAIVEIISKGKLNIFNNKNE